MKKELTKTLGQLYTNSDPNVFEMYSFDRVAHLFWCAFASRLMERGLTEQQALNELASKGTRWLLDHEGDKIEKLADDMAKTYMPYEPIHIKKIARKK